MTIEHLKQYLNERGVVDDEDISFSLREDGGERELSIRSVEHFDDGSVYVNFEKE